MVSIGSKTIPATEFMSFLNAKRSFFGPYDLNYIFGEANNIYTLFHTIVVTKNTSRGLKRGVVSREELIYFASCAPSWSYNEGCR